MKTKIQILAALSILLAFLIMGCDSGNPGPDISKLPGPPPPAPPANIDWIAQPRAGYTDSIFFTFSEDPGNIQAEDIILTGNTVVKGALNAVTGNSFQRVLVVSKLSGLDEEVTVDIPDYANIITDQKILSGSKKLTVYGTPAYFSVVSEGDFNYKGNETSHSLVFSFFSDASGLQKRDIGVLYPDDITITHLNTLPTGVSGTKSNSVKGNSDGGSIRTLTLRSLYPGNVRVSFSPAFGILKTTAAGSDTAELKTAPATFWCEVALDEWGEPRGNLLVHMTRRIDTSNLQTSNLILTGVTNGPMGIAGAAALTSMGPIDDRWGRTFGLRVSKTGDIVVQWRFRPEDDTTTQQKDDANLGEIIDLDFVCEPFTVYK